MPDRSPTAEDVLGFRADPVPRWCLPNHWTFVDEIPKTSVGKFDKKQIRSCFADGACEVQHTPTSKWSESQQVHAV